MVCSPHIGVLAGIASGGTPSYNFPRQISSYQQPSLYNGNYQGISNSRGSYQPMAISNNLYSFQNNDGKNSNPLFMASENIFQQSKLANEQRLAYAPQEQNYLSAAENLSYQSLLIAALAQAYVAQVVEQVLEKSANETDDSESKFSRSTAKNRLQELIDEELMQEGEDSEKHEEEEQMLLYHHHV